METQSSPWALYPNDVPSLVKEGPAFVESFVFANYTDPEHRCRIIDRDGKDVFNVRGSLDYSPVVIEPGRIPLWEMFLQELDSGQCYIYIR